ncbi:hypothetical protein NDU88_005228 [Pleurodeles waltl]|uniref:Endonuclease/exonuclease/phosphatase domain-containing protein n=1 Tax=Pleurodeles waltl TaxID=8319 RepID=A0AAV7PES1_PLEWA|nr:hypothetical protein NDU88_005228 [Pleurodeles waltl]
MVSAHGLRACNGRTSSDQARVPTFRWGHQRSVINYFLIDMRLWPGLVDMEVLSTTDSDHCPLAILLNGGNYFMFSAREFLALPEPSVTRNQRRVTWPRALAGQNTHAEIHQWFVLYLAELEGLFVDPNLVLQILSIFFDKLKSIFVREYQGSQGLGEKLPQWFSWECRMAKQALVIAIRECNRADIKCARARYKKAQRVARKERDEDNCQKPLQAMKLRDNHDFWAIISARTGESGIPRHCNIVPG